MNKGIVAANVEQVLTELRLGCKLIETKHRYITCYTVVTVELDTMIIPARIATQLFEQHTLALDSSTGLSTFYALGQTR